MGYCIDLIDGDFFIAAENKAAALEAMCKMWDPGMEANMSGGRYGQGSTDKWYSWMNGTEESWRNRTVPSLEAGMGEWRYHAENDEEGNIIHVWFDGEKLGDEDQMFRAIAPYVQEGSWLGFRGEEGSLWRWYFDGKTMTERSAHITWE